MFVATVTMSYVNKSLLALSLIAVTLTFRTLAENESGTLKETNCYGNKLNYLLYDNVKLNGSDYVYVKVKSKLPILCDELTRSIENCKELGLDGVDLKEFGNGSLNNLHDLQALSARDNDISTLKVREFYNLINVIKIDLSNNKIVVIKSNTFVKLPRLETINLSGNRLTTFESDWFVDCDSLSSFSLYSNRLKTIDNRLFNNLKPTNYFNVKLGGNRIETIEDDSFTRMKRVGELTLHGNLIERFDPKLLANTELVSLLDLGANRLTCIDENVINKCDTIFLIGNPFDEECVHRLREKVVNKTLNGLLTLKEQQQQQSL